MTRAYLASLAFLTNELANIAAESLDIVFTDVDHVTRGIALERDAIHRQAGMI